MLSFYQSLSMVVMAGIGFGACLARRLSGDASIGTYELVMMLLFLAFSIYMTVDAAKLAKEYPSVE